METTKSAYDRMLEFGTSPFHTDGADPAGAEAAVTPPPFRRPHYKQYDIFVFGGEFQDPPLCIA